MYKESRALHDRCSESRTMLNRFTDRLPVIIEPRDTNTPRIDKRKYRAPKELMTSQLIYVVRRRLKLRAEEAVFFFHGNRTLVSPSATVADVYSRYADDDGFLYLTYSMENTLG